MKTSIINGSKVSRLSVAIQSCLHGSELQKSWVRYCYGFLSCLHGSEQRQSFSEGFVVFLSCLYGSELLEIEGTTLNEKRLSLFDEKNPLFLPVNYTF